MPDAERERVRTIQEALDANKPGIVQIAVHYGREHQMQKLIEEMAELTVALIHEKSGRTKPFLQSATTALPLCPTTVWRNSPTC